MKIPKVKEYQGLPVVRAEKIKYIDNVMVMDYGISPETLMENAGRNVAGEVINYVKENIDKDLNDVKISVFCGRGNNGGDGLVCARYLKEKGANVKIYIIAPSEKGYGELVVKNLERAKEKNIPIKLVSFENYEQVSDEIKDDDLLVDALLGISISGKPAGIMKKIIQLMNKSGKDIISIDIPSGLMPDTGYHTGVFITAKMTLTLGFAKTGLMAAHAQKYIGKLKVLDIGYPPELIEKVREEVNKS